MIHKLSKKVLSRIDRVVDVVLPLCEYKQKHISIIFNNKGQYVCAGFNKLKTHPNSPHKYKTIHAEYDAVLHYPGPLYTLSSCFIVNVRVMKDGSYGLSKPCRSCQSFLEKVGVGSIYYSDNSAFKSLVQTRKMIHEI